MEQKPLCVNSTPSSDNSKDIPLTDYSARDKPWDEHRSQAQDVMMIYDRAEQFERYAERISHCSGVLRFGQVIDQETGEIGLKLRSAVLPCSELSRMSVEAVAYVASTVLSSLTPS